VKLLAVPEPAPGVVVVLDLGSQAWVREAPTPHPVTELGANLARLPPVKLGCRMSLLICPTIVGSVIRFGFHPGVSCVNKQWDWL
jgi:hypothetical protein